jgi:hypothetical protein
MVYMNTSAVVMGLLTCVTAKNSTQLDTMSSIITAYISVGFPMRWSDT